jgi:hypothetical protein
MPPKPLILSSFLIVRYGYASFNKILFGWLLLI